MKQAPFSDFDEAERREFIRIHTDSAERWLRHLVDVTLGQTTGPKYITQGTWKKELVRQVSAKISDRPNQFKREIDATTFDQLVDMVCHPDHWAEFAGAMVAAYPDGMAEARTFLTRIQAIRNDVAHVRPCSVRQMEQALCYSNDVAASIKAHFQRVGMAKEFYVPTFVSFNDSLGNSGHFTPSDSYLRGETLDTPAHRRLYPGDVLTIEVGIDPSFDPASYNVRWWIKTHPVHMGDGPKAVVALTEAHICQRMEVQFKLRTTNSWHRSSHGDDDVVDFYYRVLPLP